MQPYRRPQDNKATRLSVFLLKAEHLRQGKLRAHIGVQDEEGLRAAREDLISEVIDAPSGAQGCVLLQIPAVQSQEEEELQSLSGGREGGENHQMIRKLHF